MPITESHGQDQYIVFLWQNRFFLENYEVNNITKVYFDKELSKAATKNVHPPTKSFCAFFFYLFLAALIDSPKNIVRKNISFFLIIWKAQ